MDKITLFDKTFQLYIPSSEVSEIISNIAKRLNKKYADQQVVFIGILNGAFMFLSELMKQITFNCEITFVKVNSYDGTTTSGNVKTLVGLNEDLKGKTAIIVEDIIETGLTLDEIYKQVQQKNPSEILTVSLFYKPEKIKNTIKIDYIGKEIENDFIVGFGMDYNGYGRNLKDIYKLYNI